jgi:hypothetical protein
MVEFAPEPLGAMKARYSAAFATLFHAEDIELGGDTPTQHRECCFDFEDGMRLVAFRAYVGREERRSVVVFTSEGSRAERMLRSRLALSAVRRLSALGDTASEYMLHMVDGRICLEAV